MLRCANSKFAVSRGRRAARAEVKPGEHAASGLRRVLGGGGDIPDGKAEAGPRRGTAPRRRDAACRGCDMRPEFPHRIDDDGAKVVAV